MRKVRLQIPTKRLNRKTVGAKAYCISTSCFKLKPKDRKPGRQ